MDNELKKQIAKSFLNDSGDFLKRYEVLKANQTHIGNRSKLLIDIIFSFECSLKALIYLESPISLEETYKKTIKHNLKELIGMIDTSAITEIAETISRNSKCFSVDNRYALEANKNFRKNGALGELYYSTIANPVWLENIYEKACDLHVYVNSKTEKLKIKSLNDIDIDKELDNSKRISQLKKR